MTKDGFRKKKLEIQTNYWGADEVQATLSIWADKQIILHFLCHHITGTAQLLYIWGEVPLVSELATVNVTNSTHCSLLYWRGYSKNFRPLIM